MPSWKKLITSGSDAYLNSLNVANSVTASFFSGSFIGDGLGLFNVNAETAKNTVIAIKNISGGDLPKGTPLYLTDSGTSGNIVGVYPADASNPLRMPAGAIAGELLSDGEEGIGLLNGFISGVNTSAFTSGDEVYVAAGGGYTNIPPTGSALIQKLGNVEKVHPTSGSGVIHFGTFRSVPNISPGHFWVGDNDYVAVEVPTGSLFTGSFTGSFFGETTGYFFGEGSGSFSGSFQGDGSQLDNISFIQFVTHTASFTDVTSLQVLHTFQSENVVVAVYDENRVQIIPKKVQVLNPVEVLLEFSEISSGYVVVMKGGHLLQGDVLEVGDFTLHTASFSNVITTTIFHPLKSQNITVSVYNNQKQQIIPDRLEIIDNKSFELEFTKPTTGYVVITKGGHIVSGSLEDFTYRADISGSTSYSIFHELAEEYPIVQVYDTTTKKQVIPDEIETVDLNTLNLKFTSIFSGKVVVKK